jgi:hypothetical protein
VGGGGVQPLFLPPPPPLPPPGMNDARSAALLSKVGSTEVRCGLACACRGGCCCCCCAELPPLSERLRRPAGFQIARGDALFPLAWSRRWRPIPDEGGRVGCGMEKGPPSLGEARLTPLPGTLKRRWRSSGMAPGMHAALGTSSGPGSDGGGGGGGSGATRAGGRRGEELKTSALAAAAAAVICAHASSQS